MKAGQANKADLNALSVSVIVPVHNGGTALIHCLRALLHSKSQPDEIIVAANGCSDRSVEIARVCGAATIETPQAVGPAAARNTAARQARGDILFFVDADVAVHQNALERVRLNFENTPGLAACFGSYDDTPPETNFCSQYKNLFHHFIHQQADPQAATFWAGCGAVRRTVFEQMNGFDESYRSPAIEDIELGYRLTAHRHQIRLDKDLQATHLKRWSLASMLKSDIFGRAIPWGRLILRSGSLPDNLNTKMRYRFSALLAVLLAGLVPLGLFTGTPLWPALFAALLLTGLNAEWYRFTLLRKGWRWTILAIAWHWTYYLYCSIAFALVAVGHFARSQTRSGR